MVVRPSNWSLFFNDSSWNDIMNMVYHLKQPLSEVLNWCPRDRTKAWDWYLAQRKYEEAAVEKARKNAG